MSGLILPTALGADDLPNLAELNQQLDWVKSQIFIGNSASFLGPLACNMEFAWSFDFPTAATNGTHLWWNPTWFSQLPRETRKTVFVHELWHPGYLHGPRMGARNPKIWNWAGDITINNTLEREGFTFEGTTPWKDQQYWGLSTEEIYDILAKQYEAPPGSSWGAPGDSGDLLPTDSPTNAQIISNVVQATHSAKLSKDVGSIPGETETHLDKFLAPKVPWETYIYKWFSERCQDDYSWSRPNRRYPDMYLPSRISYSRLEHLIYYLDISGSITDEEVVRFNSEVRYIKDTFQPLKMTVALFDTVIQKEIVFHEEDAFDKIVVVGRGGTDLEPVRQHMMEHQPSAAIVFSDLICRPMLDGPTCDILWVAVNNSNATVPFGQIIHIKE